MKIATSLRSAPRLVLNGELNPDDVFIISQNIVTDEQTLEELVKLYRNGGWGLESEQCENIVRKWFANGQVFQYRLVEKPESDNTEGLWKYRFDCGQWHLNVDYAGADFYYNSLAEYVEAQKKAGCGAWIEYLGISSDEDLKNLATII